MEREVINKKNSVVLLPFKGYETITFKLQQTADPAQKKKNQPKVSLINNKGYHENFRDTCIDIMYRHHVSDLVITAGEKKRPKVSKLTVCHYQ